VPLQGLQSGGHRALGGPVLAGDEHVRVRRADPLDHLERRAHRRRLGDEERPTLVAQRPVLVLEPLPAAQRPRELGLGAQRGYEARVLPRLLHEVAGPAPHRLHREVDAPPGGHHDDGQARVEGLELRQEIRALAARGRVAGVVEVHEHDVRLPRLGGDEDPRRESAHVGLAIL
jgi:hypothetical protein